MQFVYPSFLWALVALAVPVLVHLFNFRRFRVIRFSNVRLLAELNVQTRRQRNLKRWLVLAARLLSLLCMVLAFCQPFFPVANQAVLHGRKAISIYLDNSYSMNAAGKEGTLLQMAKLKAKELLKGFSENDRFQVLTNDFEGRHQRWVSRDEMPGLIDEIKISPASRSMSEVQTRLAAAATPQGLHRTMFLLSDFQESTSRFTRPDSVVRVCLIPLQAAEERNVSVDSCWLESPFVRLHQPNKLKVLLHNYGNEAIENGSISLKINGSQKAVTGFSAAAGSRAETELSFTLAQAGWQACELAIVDNPVTFDDRLFFSFEVAPAIDVVCVNGPGVGDFVQDVYATDSYFRLTTLSQERIDFGLLKKTDLLVLNGITECSSGLIQEVQAYVQNGGDVLLVPAPESAAANTLLAAFGLSMGGQAVKQVLSVTELNHQHPLLSDAFEKQLKQQTDLPQSTQHFALTSPAGLPVTPLMKLQNGEWLAATLPVAKGKLTFLAVPLLPGWSNLQQHALFVPFMLRSAIVSRSTTRLFYTLGNDRQVPLGRELPRREQGYRLSTHGFETLPELTTQNGQTTLNTGGPLPQAGNYTLNAAEAGNPVIAFNYNRLESNPHCLSADELAGKLPAGIQIMANTEKDAAVSLAELQADTQLWPLLLWLCLLFIAAEIALIRLLK